MLPHFPADETDQRTSEERWKCQSWKFRSKNIGAEDCRDEQWQRTCYEKPKVKSRFTTPNKIILIYQPYQATPLFPCVELIYDNWYTRNYRSSTAVSAVGNNMADFWMESGKPYEGNQHWQEQFCGGKWKHVIQWYMPVCNDIVVIEQLPHNFSFCRHSDATRFKQLLIVHVSLFFKITIKSPLSGKSPQWNSTANVLLVTSRTLIRTQEHLYSNTTDGAVVSLMCTVVPRGSQKLAWAGPGPAEPAQCQRHVALSHNTSQQSLTPAVTYCFSGWPCQRHCCSHHCQRYCSPCRCHPHRQHGASSHGVTVISWELQSTYSMHSYVKTSDAVVDPCVIFQVSFSRALRDCADIW